MLYTKYVYENNFLRNIKDEEMVKENLNEPEFQEHFYKMQKNFRIFL